MEGIIVTGQHTGVLQSPTGMQVQYISDTSGISVNPVSWPDLFFGMLITNIVKHKYSKILLDQTQT